MNTPVVNGKAYPFMQVAPKVYRFRILNACNDRHLNLQLYYANNDGPIGNPASQSYDANASQHPPFSPQTIQGAGGRHEKESLDPGDKTSDG